MTVRGFRPSPIFLLETSLFDGLIDDAGLDELAGALYIVNGILCLFVVEAVRRSTVVNVAIPLRRATVLGLLLSLPTLLLHRQIEAIDHYFHMPEWAWLLVASGLIYLLARLHEFATETVEQLLDFRFRHAEHELIAVSEAIERAGSVDEIDRALVEEPVRVLRLASAAVFREEESATFGAAPAPAGMLVISPSSREATRCWGGASRLPPTVSRSPPRRKRPVCPKTSRGRYSLRRSRTRGAASRSFSMAGTKPAPTSTTPSATCSGASPRAPRSPTPRSRTTRCVPASPRSNGSWNGHAARSGWEGDHNTRLL